MKFFEVVAPADSPDTPGLKNAIFVTFHKHSLESALTKIFFFYSDGAAVNSGKDSWLIRLLLRLLINIFIITIIKIFLGSLLFGILATD